MTDSEEENALLIYLFGQAAQFIMENENEEKKENQRRRRKRSVWVRDWVRRRNELGCYVQI